MERRVTAALLLLVTFAWAAPNTHDFNIDVHVTATQMVHYGASRAYHQKLSVIIDGKKCELESLDMPNALLALGDYKGRLAKNQHWAGEYDSWRVYELLLPDKKTRHFVLVGQFEQP